MNLLLVDDDVVSRMALLDLARPCRSIVASAPVTLVEAGTAAKPPGPAGGGLAPVLVLCDVQMPKLSGLDLLKRARRAVPCRTAFRAGHVGRRRVHGSPVPRWG